MKKGIDVSWAQGTIDWDKAFVPDFVVIKCSTGVNAPDAQLNSNSFQLDDLGIPFTYYHWATLKTADTVFDGRAEAQDLINRLKTLPKNSSELPIILDLEEENKLKLSPEAMQLWVLAFYSELKKAGHEMWLYGYVPYFNTNLPKNHVLGHIPLWIAGYPWDKNSNRGPKGEALGYAKVPETLEEVKKEFDVRGHFLVPNGWTKDMVKMWQYTGQGKWNGINGHIDLNILF